MDLGSVFLILALAVLVAWYVSRPFFESQSWQAHVTPSAEEHERSALLAERDRVLNAIQELDFDYALGKIPQEDYPRQRAQMLKQAAEVLRSLDGLAHGKTMKGDFEDQVEAAIAARHREAESRPSRRAGAQPGSDEAHVAQVDDELEALLAQRRRERQGKAAGFCPKCGKAVQKTDRFCPKCGARLSG